MTEAQSRAAILLASARTGEALVDPSLDELVFDTVTQQVFRRYRRHWKPIALKVDLGIFGIR